MALNGRFEDDLRHCIEEMSQIREKNNGFWMGVLMNYCKSVVYLGVDAMEEAKKLVDSIIKQDQLVNDQLFGISNLLGGQITKLKMIKEGMADADTRK